MKPATFLLAALTVPLLTGAPIQTGVWYHATGDPGLLGNGLSYTGNVGTPVLNPNAAPWTFTAAAPATVTVVDLCFDTEQFEVFDIGVSLGITSAPGVSFASGCETPTPFTDDPAFTVTQASFSKGQFMLGTGLHSLTIHTIAGAPTSAAFRIDSAVPEPSTTMLLLAGIVLMFAWRVRSYFPIL